VLCNIDVLRGSVSQHSEEAYRMNRKRGKLVLICNTAFNRDLNLSDRKGTDKDIAAIQKVFRDKLHFDVVVHSELKKHEMLREIGTGL